MSEPIRPPVTGLTPEAAEALAHQGIQVAPEEIRDDATSSESAEAELIFTEEELGQLNGFTGFQSFSPGMSDGDVVDAEIVDDPASVPSIPEAPTSSAKRERSRRQRNVGDNETQAPRDAKSGPPTLDEWTKFFSRIVLKTACHWYLAYAFRGIDEDMLSEREVERLAMTDDELKTISVPFAELSNKSKFMRKHGRTLVSSGDAFNAMVVMGAWMSRVNRIAAKYRPREPKVNGVRLNGSSRQSSQAPDAAGNGAGPVGTHGGKFPPGFNGHVYIPGSG